MREKERVWLKKLEKESERKRKEPVFERGRERERGSKFERKKE